MTAVRYLRAVLFVALLTHVVSVVPGVRPAPGFIPFLDAWLNPGIIAGSAVICLIRAATVRVDRAAWTLIGTGLASYSCGTFIFSAFLTRLPAIPYPSASDALWLPFFPLAVVGIGLMVRTRMAGSSASMWLDGLVSGLGLVAVSASFVFPRLTENAGGSATAIVTTFAYPLGDLALLATVLGAMAAIGAWRQPTWIFLGAGFLCFAGADSTYLYQVSTGSFEPGGPVDAGYLVAAFLIALAAGVEPATGSEAGPLRAERRSFLVPAFFGLISISVLALGAWTPVSSLGIVLAVLALVSAWMRTGLAIREVVQLSDSRRQARTDTLTGLPNRRAFYELLEQAELGATGPGQAVASIVLIDLDRFKEINDALGHQVGDRVLRAVSQRFAAVVPPGGTIARLGGDEIALLVPGMAVERAGLLAQELLATLAGPFQIQGTSLHVDASIGVTAIEPGTSAGRALAKADLAMYRAKNSRSGWEVYEDDRDGDAWDRLATLEALREAVTGDGLDVAFQPIVIGSAAHPAGIEALVRWTHPVRGQVPPDAFLPLAESAGLMPDLTRRVLDLALDEALALRELGRAIPVSVNLSASDLLDAHLVEHIADALARRDLTGAALRIEITESLLVEGASSAQFLAQLRQLGIRLAVDDYGTGFSCLAYLHDLPVSYLKIDRGFTDRILRDERTAVIVSSTIEMAHRLSLKVVAEGVETPEQQQWLNNHGCDLLQGYHISRPVPAAALHEWLAAHPAVSDPGTLIPAQASKPSAALER